MNFDDICEGTVYEVLEEDTKKYVTTVLTHTDQHLWLKNVETGEEKKYKFGSFKIETRVGHKLYCVINKKTHSFERIVNLKTREVSNGNGSFRSKLRVTAVEYFKYFGLFALTIALPVLQPLGLLIALRMPKEMGTIFHKMPAAHYANIKSASLVMTSALLFLLAWWVGVLFTEELEFTTYWVGSLLAACPLSYFYMRNFKIIIAYQAEMGRLIDDHVTQFLKEYKPETNEVAGITEQKLA